MTGETGRYYRVPSRFWTDKTCRAWSEDMRALALYLRTSPHRNMVGLYYCPAPYMENDLQWPGRRLQTALDGLVSAGYVALDPEADLVLVIDALADQPPENENQRKAAIHALAALPPSALLERLARIAVTVAPALAEALRDRFDVLAVTVRGTVGQTVDATVGATVPETVTGTEGEPVSDRSGKRLRTVRGTVRSPESESDSDSETDTDTEREEANAPSVNGVAAIWNEVCGDILPRVIAMTEGRRRKVRARLAIAGRGKPWWADYFGRIRQNGFLRGENDRGWRADFDFAVRSEDIVTRVLEGAYDRRQPGGQTAHNAAADARPPGPPIPSPETLAAMDRVRHIYGEAPPARKPDGPESAGTLVVEGGEPT